MVGHLMTTKNLGLEQAYALCSVAVDLQISEAVNIPNAVVVASLPLEIFEER
jgi:formamidase